MNLFWLILGIAIGSYMTWIWHKVTGAPIVTYFDLGHMWQKGKITHKSKNKKLTEHNINPN